jgi:hypothetical protein
MNRRGVGEEFAMKKTQLKSGANPLRLAFVVKPCVVVYSGLKIKAYSWPYQILPATKNRLYWYLLRRNIG